MYILENIKNMVKQIYQKKININKIYQKNGKTIYQKKILENW